MAATPLTVNGKESISTGIYPKNSDATNRNKGMTRRNNVLKGLYKGKTSKEILQIFKERKQKEEELRSAVSGMKEGVAAAPPVPNVAAVPLAHASDSQMFPVKIRKTLSQGDCFYSAIYRSAREREGLLEKISSRLGIQHTNEAEFIQGFRNIVADEIVSGRLPSEREGVDAYTSLSETFVKNNNSFHEIIQSSYPSWFKEEFSEGLGERDRFVNLLAAHSRQSEEWVGEIEVRIVKELLKPLNISIEVRSNIENTLYKRSVGNDVLHLYNRSEQHYEYFSFMEDDSLAFNATNVSSTRGSESAPTNNKGTAFNIEATAPKEPLIPALKNKPEYNEENESVSLVKENQSTLLQLIPCQILYDPCSGTPITEENPLKVIQKKLHELQTAKRQAHLKELPVELTGSGKTRLDLLLWFCKQDFKTIDETSLLDYKIGTNQFSTSLFESYWDIVIALRLLSPFDSTSQEGERYLLDKKVEELNTIDPTTEAFKSKFSSDPLIYLGKRPIQTSSSGGASDITVFYSNKEANKKELDSCLQKPPFPPTKGKPTFLFCSSKLYLKEKSIDKYDIQNIYTAAKGIDSSQYNKDIILLVKNKSSVESTIQTAMRQYLSQEAKYVFGKEDMFAALRKLYDFVRPRVVTPVTLDSIRSILAIDSPPLPYLTLRLHQTMAVRIIADSIRKTQRKSNRFLIGILPRGGKTYVAGGLIRQLQAKRVVVILGAKSETQKQFVDEMFKSYVDFSDYTIVDVKDDASTSIDSGNTSRKYIFVMSIELFKQPEIEHRPLLKQLRGGSGRADLFICDEGHLKQATQKSEKAVAGATASYDEENEVDSSTELEKVSTLFTGVPVVYMTGTYRKPLLAFNIPPENTVIWDYEDLQRAKSLESEREYFEAAFGKHFTDSLEYTISQGNTMEDIMNVYRRFPEIHLMTTHFSDSAKDSFLNQDLAGKDTGFPTIAQVFTINKAHSFSDVNQWHSGFQIPDMISKLVSFLAPSVGESPPSIMDDIDEVAQRVGDRLRHFTKRFVIHSQLWFLPKVSGSPLTKRMMAFGATILHNEWFGQHFDVLSVIGDWDNTFKDVKNKRAIVSGIQGSSIQIGPGGGIFSFSCPSSSNNLKDCIEIAETNSRSRRRGLIILAQNMLQLGISLKCVDIVALLDGGNDADERIQKMYRALTESTNKKAGFVIDLNYFRSVQAITEYQIQSFKARRKVEPREEDLDSMLNNILKLYSINDNQSLFTSDSERNLEIAELKKRITTGSYKTSTTLINAGTAINRNVEENFILSQSDIDMLSEYKEKDKTRDKEFLREQAETIRRAEEVKEKKRREGIDEEDLPPTQLPGEAKARDSILRRIASGQQILKTLIRMGTFASNSKTLEDYRNILQKNPDEREILYNLLIQRKVVEPSISQERLFDAFIFPQLEKYLSKHPEGSSYKAMKEIVDDPSKYPDKTEEVLDYINKHLAPKDEERKELGQVYTPLTLVEEMLDKLPPTVWKNKDLKWLDPANGMGNFPILVFLRLDKGLSSVFPDTKKRREHIIKNMLFMLELDQKNIRISRQLFNKIAPGVEANIMRTDSLAITLAQLASKGFPEKFDVIMGNPPFNPPKGESGASSGNSIWQNFVMKSYSMLNDKGYLLFVHPPGWKKPTDEVFKPEKFANGDYTGQIRTGQVWKVLKDSGVFKFIYTNDQTSEEVGKEYLPYFPAVDYYLYQKGGDKSGCDTKNVFLGIIKEHKGVKLNYSLKYIPNLITNETLDILHKMSSKEGEKTNFKAGFDPRGFKIKEKGSIKYIYDASYKGPNYAFYSEKAPNVDISKLVLNENGGINGYYCKFIDKSEHIGVLQHTLLFPIERNAGENIEKFFKSDLVKFVFLITQYTSGKMTTNEKLVANSLTIPPEGTDNYYKFFFDDKAEEYKNYIEEILKHYETFKAPKREAKTEKKNKGAAAKPRRVTRKIRRT